MGVTMVDVHAAMLYFFSLLFSTMFYYFLQCPTFYYFLLFPTIFYYFLLFSTISCSFLQLATTACYFYNFLHVLFSYICSTSFGSLILCSLFVFLGRCFSYILFCICVCFLLFSIFSKINDGFHNGCRLIYFLLLFLIFLFWKRAQSAKATGPGTVL